MHPSEWAKAIYQKKQRKYFAQAILLLILIGAAIWVAHYIKSGHWF